MKSKLTGFYCFFVILMFLVSIFIFGFSVFSEYTQAEKRCDYRFEQLSLSLKQLTNRNNLFTKQFDDKLNDIVLPLEDFAILKIKYNSEDYFTYSVSENESETINSKIIYNKSFSFSTYDGNVAIYASMYRIRPAEISRFAKISFLLVLITTIITIILIIILNHNSKLMEAANNTEEDDNDDESVQSKLKTADEIIADMNYSGTVLNKAELEAEAAANKASESHIVSQPEPQTPIEPVTEPVAQPVVQVSQPPVQFVSQTESQIQKTQETQPEIKVEKPAKPVTFPAEEVKPMVIKENENKTPEGLFSPDTGLGWESYLKVRLENELNRAISSEVDLALFLFKIPCIEKTSSVFKEICEYLTVQFQFKDLLFEYKEDSIAAIKINTDVDQALSFAEKLQYDINEILKDYPSKCYIGISTRTVRMMSAERLLKETDEALLHAQEDDDCQIIAFRADAIKYRQFIENN